MKSVLISIQPKWCELIASGKKTVEVRKTRPKLETPFKCYIYCTKDEPLYRSGEKFCCKNGEFGNGKVIGEFVCANIAKGTSQMGSCLSMQEISEYANGKEVYGWHISDLVIYDKPKKLGEFRKLCENDLYCESCAMYSNNTGKCGNGALQIKRPPQSWCYCESGGDDE